MLDVVGAGRGGSAAAGRRHERDRRAEAGAAAPRWQDLARRARRSAAAPSVESVAVRELLSSCSTASPTRVPVERVREIVRVRPITPVPRVPERVCGVISLRGEIVEVIDLRLRLGLRAATSGAREPHRRGARRADGGVAGLLVDRRERGARASPRSPAARRRRRRRQRRDAVRRAAIASCRCSISIGCWSFDATALDAEAMRATNQRDARLLRGRAATPTRSTSRRCARSCAAQTRDAAAQGAGPDRGRDRPARRRGSGRRSRPRARRRAGRAGTCARASRSPRSTGS